MKKVEIEIEKIAQGRTFHKMSIIQNYKKLVQIFQYTLDTNSVYCKVEFDMDF